MDCEHTDHKIDLLLRALMMAVDRLKMLMTSERSSRERFEQPLFL